MARRDGGASSRHPHLASGLLAVAGCIGIAFAVVCIVMYETNSYPGPPWHALAIASGVPGALTLSYTALRRGYEDDG